ncbi:hypothetical protein BD289DRAFT_454124 [Coniella lustricola]|uniref:Uncharacterized protein n=1 Tax=Coniella lustricola TaxID=2025994 RepID=A0A2T3A4S9_9PEZI|nr:hypothetical protein BD289DRAFT_454124 [Coniella lustricola]
MSATAFFFEPEPGKPAEYPLMQPAGFKRGWTFQRPNPSISAPCDGGSGSGGNGNGNGNANGGQQQRRPHPRRPARLAEAAPLSPKSRLVRIALEDESHPCTPRTPLFQAQQDEDGRMKMKQEVLDDVAMDDDDEDEDEEGRKSPVAGSSLSLSSAMSNETRISSRSSMCPPRESTVAAQLKDSIFNYSEQTQGGCVPDEDEDVDPLQNYEDDYGDEDLIVYGDEYEDEEDLDDFDFDDDDSYHDGYYDNHHHNNNSNQHYEHGYDRGYEQGQTSSQQDDGLDNEPLEPFSECYSCGLPCEHPSTTTTPAPSGESQHYFIDVHDGLRRKAAYLFCWKCVAVFLSQMHRMPHPGCGHLSSLGGRGGGGGGCRRASARGSSGCGSQRGAKGRASAGSSAGRRRRSQGSR